MSGSGPDLRALVTGASSGIGAAFARALRARGERLVLVARRAERLRALCEALGGEAWAVGLPLDLTAEGACERLVAELESRGLCVDLLVNNAGVGDTGRFLERPLEASLNMLDLNARVMLELTRRLLPAMVERRRGAVINVVSTSAFQPVPYLAVYAASKAFALSFSEALGDELRGTGVHVQTLCPGLTATEFQGVAGTDRVPFNRTAAMTPDAVVAASLARLARGSRLVVPGLMNRLSIAAQRLLPRRVVRQAAGALFRPSTGS